MRLKFLTFSSLLMLASSAVAGAAALTPAPAANAGTPVAPQLYRLGPGDEIKVQQPNAEELDGTTARVDDQGNVNLPLVGRIAVGGLTVEETDAPASRKAGTRHRHHGVSKPAGIRARRGQHRGRHSITGKEDAGGDALHGRRPESGCRH